MAKLSTITRGSSPTNKIDFRWENSEPEKAHETFTSWADRTRDLPTSIERRKRNLLYASMYANLPMLGFGMNQYTRSMANAGVISLNVTQNAIDSLVAKVCKNDPRPMFTTVAADFELREKAENADRYVDGLFTNHGYYDKVHPGAVLDCSIYGLGVAKNHNVDGQAVTERTFCHEMLLDERQCMYGEPPRLGQRKYYDKTVLFDMWRGKKPSWFTGDTWEKDLEDAIEKGGAENDPDYDDYDRDADSDQILTYEGYTVAGKNSKGNRILCIRGMTLAFEDWKYTDTPYTFLQPMVVQHGIYGIGCAEKIIGIQREINRIVRDIQMSMNLIAKPHWMVEASSNVTAAMLNNDIATIIRYSGGVPPHVYTPAAMAPEVYSHLQFLYRTAYEILGVSQLSAQSQKPAGIDSAVGMRTYLNVETERFGQFVKASEYFAAMNARKTARVLGDIGPVEDVLAPSRGDLDQEKVTWKPLDLENTRVQVYAASKLPDTPAGRREFALELAQYGIAKTEDIYEMLEWADTEAFAKRRLAGRKNVEKDIALIRRGKNIKRDAIGNHQMAKEMMSDAYEEAKQDNLPGERLAAMREYIRLCDVYLNKPASDGAPPQPLGPPGAPPPAALGPAPGQPPIPGAPGAGPPPLPNAPVGVPQ